MSLSLTRLPQPPESGDIHRERASLQPSEYRWSPLWNRTHNSSYYHNVRRDEVRVSDMDTPGPYRIVHVGPTAVSGFVNVLQGSVATLWPGTAVEVLAVVLREDLQRVRARIKRPGGWISLLNLQTGYRYAVKADTYIVVNGAVGLPGINGRYERDANEDERGEHGFPRYKQTNGGQHYLRLSYASPAAVWMITTLAGGPPDDDQIRCDSRYSEDPFPPGLTSLPPTFPAAWCAAGAGMDGPMPSLVISFANQGNVKPRLGKSHRALGVVRLDYGYDPHADEVESSASMGYDLRYRVVPRLTPEAMAAGHWDERLERNLRGAVQRLEQLGAHAITGDNVAMVALQQFAREASSVPTVLSPLVQWPLIACVGTEEDRYLVLTRDEGSLRQHGALIASTCGLDLHEDRIVVRSCGEIPGLLSTVQGAEAPSERVEALVVQIATAPITQDGPYQGILMECAELLPYADAVRFATGLPTWDAVTAADLYTSALTGYERYEYEDWQAELEHEHGIKPGDCRAGGASASGSAGGPSPGKRRLIGVLTLDYVNAGAPEKYMYLGSHGYELLFRSVKGLTWYLATLGKLTNAVEANIQDAMRWMEEQGICALMGDGACYMAFQATFRETLSIPVFMSPMIQCQTIIKTLSPNERLLVLTRDDQEFTIQRNILLSHCGCDIADPRFVVCAVKDVSGLAPIGKGDMVDPNTVAPALLDMVTGCLREWPKVSVHIGAILLECAQLCPYAEALRVETGLPVFDAVTCAEFLVSARHDSFRFGIKQWPHEWDRKVEEG